MMKSHLIPLIGWNLISFIYCEEAWNHTEFKYPDVEETREHNRLLGVAVSIGLCMIFLFMFCISFTYYKLKEHQQQKLDDHLFIIREERPVVKKEEPKATIQEEPYVIIKESTSISRIKQASPSEQPSGENWESVTQITKF